MPQEHKISAIRNLIYNDEKWFLHDACFTHNTENNCRSLTTGLSNC